MKILVRAPNWIGDQILAYPFFYYLRKLYPRAKIVSACVPWVSDIQFRRLVDDVVVLNRPATSGFMDRWRATEESAAELRKQGRWDLSLLLPNSLSSAWLAWRSGVERRRGYGLEGRGILLNESKDWSLAKSKHRAQAYVDLLKPELKESNDVKDFWGIPPVDDLDPGVPGVLKEFDAEQEWPGTKWLTPPQEPYWVLAPGATADSRRWPVERFAGLARKIRNETGWSGVIVGGPKEAVLASRLAADRSLGLVDRVAEGPLPSLWPIFKQARFTVTNESGLAHVSSLCGSMVQIVCGAADPRRTRPLGPGKVQVAVNPIECWPCEKNTCRLEPPAQKFSCLLGIEVEAVWEEISRALQRAQTRV